MLATLKILAMPFRNEVEILEVKLATIGPLVDKIVISEGQWTFSGRLRELVFPEFLRTNAIAKHYKDKIIYQVDEEMINADPVPKFGQDTAKRWGIDIHLRNSLRDAVGLFEAKDVCILTDCDEIPDPDWVMSLDNLKYCEHTLMWRHSGYVNYRAPQCRLHEQVCRAFPVSRLKSATMEELARCEPDNVVGHADKGFGHHFTFMGGPSAIVQKLHDFAHGEFDQPPYNTIEYVEKKLFTGKDLFGRTYNDCIKVDDSELPLYLVENKDKFGHLWSPNN